MHQKFMILKTIKEVLSRVFGDYVNNCKFIDGNYDDVIAQLIEVAVKEINITVEDV